MKQKCKNCYYWTKATWPEPKPKRGTKDDLVGPEAPKRRKMHYCKLYAYVDPDHHDVGARARRCPEFEWCWDAKRLRYPAQSCVFCAKLGGHMLSEDGETPKPEFYCTGGRMDRHTEIGEICDDYEPATKKHRRTEVG